MKRKRVRVRDVPPETYQALLENPARIIQYLTDMNLAPPGSTEFILACLKTSDYLFDFRFYPDQTEFLTEYTACLLKGRSDYEFHTFRYDGAGWEMFLPPPVVGLGLRTRLRPGSQSI